MSRPLRVLYANAWYHVMNRGAGKRAIFKNNLHRNIFLELLEQCHTMFNLNIHAYCLMDNHYHLLLQTQEANLPKAMRHLNGVYTQRYNQLTNTDGPLFRGRYKSQLIEDDCYQLTVSRYIHLNPTKAKMVRKLSDYIWSSYRAYIGITRKPQWLTTDVVLSQINSRPMLRHIPNYRSYVEHADIEEINVFASSKITAPILGSEDFRTKIINNIDPVTSKACAPDISRASVKPDIERIIQTACKYFNKTRAAIITAQRGQLNWPRLATIYICRKHYGHNIQTIARAFHPVSRTTIGTTITKCETRLQQHPKLKKDIISIASQINN